MDRQPRDAGGTISGLQRSRCLIVVAVGTGPSMPTRPYSSAILAGLWPTTSADAWSDVADGQRQKAHADADIAEGIRRAADGLYLDNSGHMIDGMHGMYMHDRMAVMDQS